MFVVKGIVAGGQLGAEGVAAGLRVLVLSNLVENGKPVTLEIRQKKTASIQ